MEMVDVLWFGLPAWGHVARGKVARLAAGPLYHHLFEGAGGIS